MVKGGGHMSIRVVARDHLKPECKEEALKLVEELIAATRKEEGNISYNYCQDAKDPDYFAMIECWETEEALQAHLKSEHFTRIIPKLGEMLQEPGRLEVYREIL